MRLKRAGIQFYIIGILFITLGVALTIHSNLGTSPADSLLVGLYRTFGLTIGSWEIIVGFTLVVFNALAQKKGLEYYAILTSIITGIGIDTWYFIVRNWLIIDTWIGQLICLVFGILLTGIGVATYLQSNLSPNPMDRTMLVISKLTGWSVMYSRLLINIVFVTSALFFNGPIGIGTLLDILLTGVIVNFCLSYAEVLKNRLKMSNPCRCTTQFKH